MASSPRSLTGQFSSGDETSRERFCAGQCVIPSAMAIPKTLTCRLGGLEKRRIASSAGVLTSTMTLVSPRVLVMSIARASTRSKFKVRTI